MIGGTGRCAPNVSHSGLHFGSFGGLQAGSGWSSGAPTRSKKGCTFSRVAICLPWWCVFRGFPHIWECFGVGTFTACGSTRSLRKGVFSPRVARPIFRVVAWIFVCIHVAATLKLQNGRILNRPMCCQ